MYLLFLTKFKWKVTIKTHDTFKKVKIKNHK